MTATLERILFYRNKFAIAQGALILGDSGGVSGSPPGGTTTTLLNTDGWHSPPDFNGNILRQEAINTSFDSNGGGEVFAAGTQNIEPALLFPPYGPRKRIYRARNITYLRVTQADATTPQTCRYFYGFFKEFDIYKPLSNLDLGAGWIGFYAKSLGLTWGNWYVKICDDSSTSLQSVDTGISADQQIVSLRIDIDGIEQKIRHYIDEVLVNTYAPASGVLGGGFAAYQRLGRGFNVGFETGASTHCIAERLGDVLCYNDAFLTEEYEEVTS